MKTEFTAGGPAGGGSSLTTTELDFQGKNAKDAIVDEILERLESTRGLPYQMPRALLRVDGQIKPLPLSAEYAVDWKP